MNTHTALDNKCIVEKPHISRPQLIYGCLTGAGQLWLEWEGETQFGTKCGGIHTQVQPGTCPRHNRHSEETFISPVMSLIFL